MEQTTLGNSISAARNSRDGTFNLLRQLPGSTGTQDTLGGLSSQQKIGLLLFNDETVPLNDIAIALLVRINSPGPDGDKSGLMCGCA